METENQATEQQQETPQQQEQTSQPDPAVVKRARDLGWVPETEWRGEPPRGGFKTPEDFIARGEEVLPIVKSQLKTQQERADKLERELSDERKSSSERFAKLDKMTKVALDQQRSKIVQEFEERQDKAAEVGDVAQVKALRKEERDALAEFDKQTEEPAKTEDDAGKNKGQQLPGHIKQAIDGWVAENDWFTSDKEMHDVANRAHERFLKEQPGLSIGENLAEVRAYVAKRYPEKFGKADADTGDGDDQQEEKPRRGSPVEGGVRVNGGGNGTSWSKLPADAKTQADIFIKEQGLFLERGETAEKNLQSARERYAKKYWEQPGV